MGWWSTSSKPSASEPQVAIDDELKKYSDDAISQLDHKAPTNGSTLTAADYAANRQHFGRSKSLKRIALDNCAEYAAEYAKCQSQGSLLNRSSGCPTELAMFEKCQDMQTEALTMLGYAEAVVPYAQKAIKMLADDLMIKTAPSLIITPDQEKAFHDLLVSYKKK